MEGEISTLYATVSDLFPPKPSRAQKRQLQIADAAIENYSKEGIERATYERIAKTCGISRTLILHYFPEREDLFHFTVRYIRLRFQNLAIDALKTARHPRESLEKYVESTYRWTREYPDHAKTWVLFYYYCGINPRSRRIHTELVSMGHQRIISLLKTRNAFRCSDPAISAKLIQTVITGALITIGTEDLPMGEAVFKQKIVDLCLQIADA